MRSIAQIKRVKHERYKFVVIYPEVSTDGQRHRRKAYFHTREEATAFAAPKRAELESHGAKHAHVADDERAALIRFRTWAETQKEPVSLLSLVNHAIEARERSTFKSTVQELIDSRILQAQRKRSSRRHLADLEIRLKRFDADFGPRLAADVEASEIEHWLHGLNLGAVSFGNYKRAVGSVFALAVKQGKLATNPVSRVEAPKIVRAAPSILTPSQLRHLLAAASPDLLPLLVLQAFAGVRRAEAERLTWAHIHLDTATPCVELPGEITKTNRRRSIDLPPNAVAWLTSAVSRTEGTLGLSHTVYRRRLTEAAKTAGIDWNENLLRHSYGSYRLAQTKNAAQVAEEMGNSPAVVHTHYQNLVRPERVSEYWSIAPKPAGSKLVAFPAHPKRKAS